MGPEKSGVGRLTRVYLFVFSQKISSCSLVCFCWFVGSVGHPFIGLSCNVILGFIYLLIGFQTTC
jgi:hypothetical protein